MRTISQIEAHLAETTVGWHDLSLQDRTVLIELDRLAEKLYEEVRRGVEGSLPFEAWKKVRPQ